MDKRVKNPKEIKVGNFIMNDGGGVGFARFGEVIGIDGNKFTMKNVYRRQRVSLYPGHEDVFTFEPRETFYYDDISKWFKMTKTEYNKLAKTYEKFAKLFDETCEVFSRIYFDQKK